MTRKRRGGFLASAGLVTMVVATLAACGGGSARTCEEALTAAATSVVYVRFGNEDGTTSVHEGLAGFNGTPSIGDLREHYGITPGEGSTSDGGR